MSHHTRAHDVVDGLPNICGNEELIKESLKKKEDLYSSISNIDISRVQSVFGTVLHMHQPTIPGSSPNLHHAHLISNLQYMLEHQDVGDNHNAPVFLWCYYRMADFVRELVDQGKNPRVMLDYSGALLWGLRQIEGGNALERLKAITCDRKYRRNIEWLGTMWAHAVATSTPVPDIKLQALAWKEHFATIFGEEAVNRIKGFSPPEMHLPIHPDVCYEYIKVLKECGYEWMAVQEHTIENLDGTGVRRTSLPHKLVAKNSLGKVEEITILIKTQGSDSKLIAQMQPYYEAKSKGRDQIGGKSEPSYVLQVGDGENGGVMMNEFPPMYKQVFGEVGLVGTVGMNGSEYLEFLRGQGVDEKSFTPVQPTSQGRIWREIARFYPGAADDAIKKIHEKDQGFNLDKGSWTNDRNWVKGYEHVLDPIKRLSVEFHKKYDGAAVDTKDPRYRTALLYLLLSQSSDFRYWGSGAWTEYAKEVCRRGMEALK